MHRRHKPPVSILLFISFGVHRSYVFRILPLRAIGYPWLAIDARPILWGFAQNCPAAFLLRKARPALKMALRRFLFSLYIIYRSWVCGHKVQASALSFFSHFPRVL
jgi:hypothetical protein